MSTECKRFRAALEDAAGGPPERLAALADDSHVRACDACRRELARERGLERLLDAVPAPEAPAGLSRRVLAALASERSKAAAREHGHEHDAAEGERELDELLARVPAPVVPAGLAARVLAGLAPVRAPRATRPVSLRRLVLVAAVVLVALGLWAWTKQRARREEAQLVDQSDAALESDEELLAYTVERWELLHDEDLDVWLASLDPVDELLIDEYADGDGWIDGAVAPAPRSEEGQR